MAAPSPAWWPSSLAPRQRASDGGRRRMRAEAAELVAFMLTGPRGMTSATRP